MADYIDREELLTHQYNASHSNWPQLAEMVVGVEDIEDAPAADVAPVVRCRECKHCRELNRKDRIEEAYADGVLWCTNQLDGVWPDDYCSYGERRGGGEDG